MTTTLSFQIRSLWAPRLLLADICRLQNAKGSVGGYECLKSYPKYRKEQKKCFCRRHFGHVLVKIYTATDKEVLSCD